MTAPWASGPGLRHLRPIALDAFVETAALQTRIDRKCLVPRDRLDAVVSLLGRGAAVLTGRHGTGSRYASTYFDTPDLESYRMAATGRRRRVKVRTRSYLDSGGAFLEVKAKGARAVTQKERIPHDPRAVRRLGAAGAAYVAEAVAAAGAPLSVELLRPVLDTSYTRAAILLPAGGGRTSIDVDLVWRDAGGRELGAPGLAIVETKSPAAPSAFDRALWRSGLRPRSISKYATGLAAFRPELGQNRWSRTVRDDLRPALVDQHTTGAAAPAAPTERRTA